MEQSQRYVKTAMTLVTAVIRPSKLDDVIEALSSIGVGGFTVTEVKGFGRQAGQVEVYRGAEYEVTSVPEIEIETAIPDDLLDKVIETLERAARTGKIGDGKIFVSALEQTVRIRTGEKNEAAL
jgi:nitrogen regulatory protein P-II 2